MGRIRVEQRTHFAAVERLEDRRLLSATLVKDITPGPDGSSVSRVYEARGIGLFTTREHDGGLDLWRTDGSEVGTRKLKDFDRSYLTPGAFVAFNGAVYFFADDVLWRTDGTPGGTVAVQDDPRARYFAAPHNLTVFDGALYFWDMHAATRAARLWRSDGTAAGLSRVLPLQATMTGASQATGELAPLGDALVFEYANALYRTDGTRAGTSQLAGVEVRGPLHRLGDALVFVGHANGRSGVWRTDGTAAGTSLVKDLHAGEPATGEGLGVVQGGTLSFAASNGTHGTELWKTDGTAAGTAMVADLFPIATPSAAGSMATQSFGVSSVRDVFRWPSPTFGSGSFVLIDGSIPAPRTGSEPANFHLAAGRVVFTAWAPTIQGPQLFSTDGTAAGTVQLANLGLYQGTYGWSSAYREFRNVGDALFFSVRTSESSTGDLYVTDGTAGGTRRVWSGGSSSLFQSGISGLSASHGSLLFSAWTYHSGQELMRWDDTGGMTGVVHDDPNGNGVRDATEILLPGWRVFIDRNRDGAFNPREPFVYTDAQGRYSFPAHAQGDFALGLSPGAGFTAPAAVAARVRKGQVTWHDVGATRTDPRRGSVGGNVFGDADFDGAFSAAKGDGPTAGVRVFLDLNRNGSYSRGEPFAFSDAAGNYRIADLLPGQYRVAVSDLGPGFEYTRGVERTLVVVPGASHDVDFGLGYDGGNGMIHGVLFNDRDRDGKQDANEPGLAGLTMSLTERQWMAAGIFGRTAVTDAGGYYKFAGLRRGEYTLSAGYPGVEWHSPQEQMMAVPLSAGQRALRSWGLAENGTASISGKAFADRNADGAWGSEDVAAPGWWVYADLDRDGERDGDEPASQTSSTGAYALSGLMSGTYLVRFVPAPEGEWTFTHGKAATEITLTPRQQLRLNAGAAGPPSGVITGTVYYDRDGDVNTAGDPVKSGVTVFLDLNGNRTYDPGTDRSAVTDAQGRYRFTKVPSGTSYVIPIAPAGWGVTTPVRSAPVTNDATTEFPTLGVSDRGMIYGPLFHDVNKDGKLAIAQGDRFLANYTVYIDADNDGVLDAGERSTPTSQGGVFRFVALPLETYVIRFIPRADDLEHPVVAGSITVALPKPAGALFFPAVTP